MKAALVTAFDTVPEYADVPDPVAAGPGEQLVEVLGAAVHRRVRSQADGSHYTSTGVLPLVPGVDGVGRTADGELRYFVLPDTALGSMAERTLIDPRRSVPLPAHADPVLLAAGMNPAMSSWVALRRRVEFRPGDRVLVLGATGSSGSLAVQIARRLGASRVVAAGRTPEKLGPLRDLGADEVLTFDQVDRAADIDVVLDYVWGEPTAAAMTALVTARSDRGRPLTWVQIGSVAGPTAAIPSAALRAARLQVVGSGQGSVSTRDIVGELPELAALLVSGELQLDVRAVPLAQVGAVWAQESADRVVLVP